MKTLAFVLNTGEALVIVVGPGQTTKDVPLIKQVLDSSRTSEFFVDVQTNFCLDVQQFVLDVQK